MSVYFQGLNYGLANEDTWIEYDLSPRNIQSMFAVCGSGSRVTPLLAKNPTHMHVVDLSETQLALFRLRFASMKYLSYNEYLFFLGYLKQSNQGSKRTDLITKLNLSPEDTKLWKSQEDLWNNNGFIYLGRWERHFMKVGKIFQKLTMTSLKPLFEAKDITEQKEILNEYWNPKLFRLYTKFVMNEWVANKLLYKGHYAGASGKKTMEISAAEFVFREINDLFQNTWVKGNYFLNMIFMNSISHSECLPAEGNEEVFELVKKCETQIHFHKRNLLDLLLEKGHDFYSLSDTFSYMQDSEVKDFLSKIPIESQKPIIVVRTFMRRPDYVISSPWITDDRENKDLAKKDCTRMYDFNILRRL